VPSGASRSCSRPRACSHRGASSGVTRLIVYRIFETKEALYRAVLDSVVTDIVDEFTARGDERLGIAEVLLRVARRHPDGFRLLWRQAVHEPDFAELASEFRASVNAYADTLLRAHFDDDVIRHWAAESIVAHFYESICLWLDHGDEGRDDEFVGLLANGNRAMIEQWVRTAARER
jgi:AcrR family transcriptional regulator